MLVRRWVLLALLCLGATTIARAQQFLVAPQFATGEAPYAVAVADVNGDGIPDLVTGDQLANAVSVMLGNGDGTFQPQVEYTTGFEPISIVVADLNQDGKLDVAVTNFEDDTIGVLLGNGDGTFQTQVIYQTAGGPFSIAAGDVNGDGIPDLVVACSATDQISVLIGKGLGTFKTHVDYATGNEPVSAALGDFNNDGKLDVATADYANSANTGVGNTVSVLLNAGSGTFNAHVDYTTGPSGSGPVSVAAGLVNSDSTLDLVVANEMNNTIGFLKGNGDGTFQSGVDYATGTSPHSAVLGNLNNDGFLDVAVVNELGNTASVLLGNGDGTFQNHVDFGTAESPVAVAVGTFISGGATDLAVANGAVDTVSILMGNGNGTFQARRDFATGEAPLSAASADFNNDGKPDAVVANLGSNTVDVYLGNGDGSLQAPASYSTGGTSPFSVVTGNFAGGSIADLAVANLGSNNVAVLVGTGTGTFNAAVEYSIGSGSEPIAVATGDFNKDGKLDLAVADLNADTVSVLLGNGDGTFQSPASYATGLGPHALAVTDINGDGKLDLVVANSVSNTVSVLLGNGDGTFQAHVDYSTGSEPTALAAGAFVTSSSLPGVVTADLTAGPGGVCALLNSGTGTLLAPVCYAAGQNPEAIVAADFNGNGELDLAAANSKSDTASIMLGNGDGTFQNHVDFGAGAAPYSLAIADFNLDGAPDLLSANEASNTVSVLLNMGGTLMTASGSPNPANPNQQVIFTATVATGVNVTGRPAPTGTVSFYNGSTLLGTGTLSSGVASYTDSAGFTTNATIFADYSGDSNYNPHNLPPFTEVVNSGAPQVTLSPTSLNFGNVVVNTTSPAQVVTLTNTGNAALSITSITPSKSYNEKSTTCPLSPSTLGAGLSCTINVTFKPTKIGTVTGTLSITDNASGSPQSVSLTGVGTQIQLTPATLNLGSVPVGQTSAPQTVTLKNVGTTSVTIKSMTFTGTNPSEFKVQSNTCGSSVAAGASCSINITFSPTKKGVASAVLNVNDTGGGSPQTSKVGGTGT
ncbi:MAG TPA: FG-GAP-like repeat-containing protein [Terriglobia bacterium]|nr:FG-GAP-like repeat-containing protein [Terriglobia bacterium]